MKKQKLRKVHHYQTWQIISYFIFHLKVMLNVLNFLKFIHKLQLYGVEFVFLPYLNDNVQLKQLIKIRLLIMS